MTSLHALVRPPGLDGFSWLFLAYYRRRSHQLATDEKFNNSWMFVFLRAIDLFIAALIWRTYGVTISAFTGLECRRWRPALWAVYLGAFLVFLQNNHCEQAIRCDLERAVNAQRVLT